MEERRYSYSFLTESRFSPAVERHFFKLRMVPCNNFCQHLMQHEIDIHPDSPLLYATDGFGNQLQFGNSQSASTSFRAESRGIVSCHKYLIPDDHPNHLWLCPSQLVSWDERLKEWARQQVTKTDDHHTMALQLMHSTHSYLTYRRFITDNVTTALQVFETRQGVCQDFAHFMIAACRSMGVSARYVNGLVEGVGETHAWVEVYDGRNWRAYDPTYDREVQWGFIKLAHGRDVGDCPSNRGRFYGWTSETMTVQCMVTEFTHI